MKIIHKGEMLYFQGLSFIEYILENFDITLNDNESNEIELIKIQEQFKQNLSTIGKKYIFANRAKAIENENNKLKQEIEQIKKEKSEGFKEQYKEEIQKLEEHYKKMNEVYKQSYLEGLERIKTENEKNIEDMNKKLDKWKAMYTGQAEANAKLINKYEV